MKDLRCLLARNKYVTMHSPDGSGSYLECRRCGKVKDVPGGIGGLLGGIPG